MSSTDFICAKWTPDSTDCKKGPQYSCKNCLLLSYCCPACQKSHWPTHKTDCRSLLGKPTWKQYWFWRTESRPLSKVTRQLCRGRRRASGAAFRHSTFSKFASSDGENFAGPIRLLFAVSGDLGDVVKTIAQLPTFYSGSVEITNVDEAIECIVHLWYSALIRKSDLDILQQRFLDLGRLLSFMEVLAGLLAKRAKEIRTVVTLADSRKDYRNGLLLFQTPAPCIAKKRFREDGLLLPFGHTRHDFKEPNPEWSLKGVVASSSGAATAGIYGKLFYHLHIVLRASLVRLSGMQVAFLQFQMEVSDDCMETTREGQMADMNPDSLTRKWLLFYLPTAAKQTGKKDPVLIKLTYARDIVANHDHVFDRFAKLFKLSETAQCFGATEKEKHTVIENWPLRVKLRPGQPGSQVELDRVLDSGVSTKERYVEWKRTAKTTRVTNSLNSGGRHKHNVK
ncbi:hypothetical protein N657DRAFT_658451 [Parathielavia appendiculata]|uniref:MYND-type domain-containing protein n=1 Tax=Parathielavia appendiculata TaxID=2587402 RepID=A0AAN6Z018_9PEZI|nr:hypothetical protein N657DRAFT_658451 [Parathielavia appendiculata]